LIELNSPSQDKQQLLQYRPVCFKEY